MLCHARISLSNQRGNNIDTQTIRLLCLIASIRVFCMIFPPPISEEMIICLNLDNFQNHNLIYADENSVQDLKIWRGF